MIAILVFQVVVATIGIACGANALVVSACLTGLIAIAARPYVRAYTDMCKQAKRRAVWEQRMPEEKPPVTRIS